MLNIFISNFLNLLFMNILRCYFEKALFDKKLISIQSHEDVNVFIFRLIYTNCLKKPS